MSKIKREQLIDALAENDVENAADNGDVYEALKDIYVKGISGYQQKTDRELVDAALKQGVLEDESEFKRTSIRAGGKPFLREEAIRRLVNVYLEQARNEGVETFLKRLLREGHAGFDGLPEDALSQLLEKTIP